MKDLQEKIKKSPKEPGVYIFKDKKDRVIYVGKAKSLKKRVSQYFQNKKNLSAKNKKLVENISDVKFIICESEIDALITESINIKKYNPKYNVLMRDDKNYFFVGITKEDYPRIFITHQPKKTKETDYIGPFTEGFALKETLKILRKTFPYRHCIKLPKKACLQYHLERCPAPCIKKNQKTKINQNIKYIKKILRGEKNNLCTTLKKQMLNFAKKEEFEKAQETKKKIENIEKILKHKYIIAEFKNIKAEKTDWQDIEKFIQKILNTKDKISRVEAFDISNISGKYAVGSMVVFVDGEPDKKEYRKFKIKYTEKTPNDPKMMKEVLLRRFKNKNWKKPDLIILDGGITQLNSVLQIAPKNQKIISLAKKNEEIYIPFKKDTIKTKKENPNILFFFQNIRDEAHRFAITFHRKKRKEGMLK